MSVLFDRRDREIALLLAHARDPKFIAGALEIAISTAYERINAMCFRAKVADRVELLIYVLQHPACMFPGVESESGLHDQPCPCGSPYCLGMIAAQFPLEVDKPWRRKLEG